MNDSFFSHIIKNMENELRTYAKYVTKDEFLNFTGIDLDAELKDNGTAIDTSKSERFLGRVEMFLMDYIDSNSFRNYDWDSMTAAMIDSFKKATLYQAEYMFRNGDLTSDSGYDPDRGTVIARESLNRIMISQTALNALKRGGLLNRVMANRRRWTKLF